MAGYIAFWRGQRHELYADCAYEAQKKAAKFFGAKKTFHVTVMLAEVAGQTVIHDGAELHGA